jgi:hypothetical protein
MTLATSGKMMAFGVIGNDRLPPPIKIAPINSGLLEHLLSYLKPGKSQLAK